MQKPQTQLFVWSLRDIIHDADLYVQALLVNTATQEVNAIHRSAPASLERAKPLFFMSEIFSNMLSQEFSRFMKEIFSGLFKMPQGTSRKNNDSKSPKHKLNG